MTDFAGPASEGKAGNCLRRAPPPCGAHSRLRRAPPAKLAHVSGERRLQSSLTSAMKLDTRT